MLKAVLFDLDGVLIDSRYSMMLAWDMLARQNKLKISFDCYLSHVGLPFEDILSNLKIKTELHGKLKAEYSALVSCFVDNIKPYRSVRYLLNVLKSMDMKVAIVTSKEFWRTEVIVDNFLFPIDLIITPEKTERGKPSPEPILAALSAFKINSSEAIYIGDMYSDYLSAKGANVDFFYASWGYGRSNHNIMNKCALSYPEEIIDIINDSNSSREFRNGQ